MANADRRPGPRGTLPRAAALVAGLALLAAGRLWIAAWTANHALFGYDIQWFLKLGPGEGGFYLRVLGAGLSAAALLAWGLAPPVARALPFLRRAARSRTAIPVLAGAAALLVLGAARWLLRNQVVTDDEYVYLFQARLLQHGRAAWPAPDPSPFFQSVFVAVRDGRWFGQYPPGHPLALVPALALGLPRLLPVTLAAANTALTAAVVSRLAGRAWGTAAAALLLVSPLFLLTGATLLSHPTSYFALALAAYAGIRVLGGGRDAWGLAAGLALGLLLLTRPWTAVTLGLFPVLLGLAALRRGRRAAAALAVLGGLAGVAVFLLYNRATTGHAFTTGYQALRTGGMKEFGFGTIIPGVHDHTPLQGLVNAALLALRLHFWALGWPLILVPAVLAFGRIRRRERGTGRGTGIPGLSPRRAAVGAGAMLLLGLLAYVPYWSIGVNDTGPVKTYELLLPLTVLIVLGWRSWSRRRGPAVPAAWALASTLAAAILFWPVQITHLRGVSASVAAPLEAVRDQARTPAVVFTPPRPLRPPTSWVFGWPDPSPDLSDPILFVRDFGKDDALFLRAHPHRTPYRIGYNDGRFVLRPLLRKGTPPSR